MMSLMRIIVFLGTDQLPTLSLEIFQRRLYLRDKENARTAIGDDIFIEL